jgi:hypothetical protein
MLKAKQIKRGIPELGPIVTVYGFQAVGMLIAQPQSQAPKCSNTSTLPRRKPRATRIVINDDKNMPFVSHGVNPRGIDIVHME